MGGSHQPWVTLRALPEQGLCSQPGNDPLRGRWEYVRRLIVKERVLAERGRSCQLCRFTFRTKQGHDYAEAHHIIPVSEHSLDNPDNLLVLCANHHRQLHYADVEWPEGLKRPPAVVINGGRYPIRWNA